MTHAHRAALAAIAIWIAPLITPAATPPTTVNYQGVLRNASDKPLAGTYDMLFGFYDAPAGGTQIMTDQHAAVSSNAVTVTGGLFDVQLGSGSVTDGTGAGTYTSLGDVFRDYGTVYVEIRIGAETLSPRVKIQSTAYALNATNLNGRAGSGYVDTSSSPQTKAGPFVASATGASQYGVQGYGTNGGGYFAEQNGNSALYAGYTGFAAYGIGASGGAYLTDTTGSSAYAAHSGNGIEGYGPTRGGRFGNTGNASSAELATTDGFGISSHGPVMGGYFVGPGNAHADVGFGGYGVLGVGSNAGGYFTDLDDGAAAYLGSNGWGVYALAPLVGSSGGGFFSNGAGNAYAVLGTDNGSAYGGPFAIKAVVNDDQAGRWAGDFVNAPSGLFSRIAYIDNFVGSSIWGNGSKNFVQNHPLDPTKMIAYACLEGDEVGTYTRGTARLVHGEARITLGETFQWVTNPDVGLTVQLTPRGSAALLYVVSLSTTELVVRAASGDANAAFDYAVHGLRVGFEEAAVVADRTVEAKLPAVTAQAQRMSERPDLQRYTPLSRFREMAASAGIALPADDMARGLALRKAIGEYDRARDAEALAGPEPTTAPRPSTSGSALTPRPVDRAGAPIAPPAAPPLPSTNPNLVEVAERVSAGDLLALDPAGLDSLRLARDAASPGVVGIVAGEAGASWTGTAPLALGGSIVSCHVDATYGAIAPGDLLVASATPGHAMRAGDGPHEGRVIAKALQAWTAGIGTIRVVVMTR